MHLCHIHIDRTAERVVRRRKRREQMGGFAIFVIKAWPTKFKKKTTAQAYLHAVTFVDMKNLPSHFRFGEYMVFTAECQDQQPVCTSIIHFGTCTIGWPPADAFTAPRLPSVS